MSNLHRSNFQDHSFHLVSPSPWPLFTCISLLTLTTSGVLAMHGFSNSIYWLPCALICLIASIYLWFKHITSKGAYLGNHILDVQKGWDMGVTLFIVFEALFFLATIWAYFHSALSPNLELGAQWPPIGIEAINAFELPLLNTVLLLLTSVAFTYFFQSLILLIKTFFKFLFTLFKIHPLLAYTFILCTIVIVNGLGFIITSLYSESFLNFYFNLEIENGYFLNSSGGGNANQSGGFHFNNMGGSAPTGAGQPVISQDNYWKRYLLNYLVDKKSTWTMSDGNLNIIPPLTGERLSQHRDNLRVKDFSVLFTHVAHYTDFEFPQSSIFRFWQVNPRAFDMIPANTRVSDLILSLNNDLNASLR